MLGEIKRFRPCEDWSRLCHGKWPGVRQGTSSQYQYCYLDLVIWYSLFVSSTNSIQIVRRQCCLVPVPIYHEVTIWVLKFACPQCSVRQDFICLKRKRSLTVLLGVVFHHWNEHSCIATYRAAFSWTMTMGICSLKITWCRSLLGRRWAYTGPQRKS